MITLDEIKALEPSLLTSHDANLIAAALNADESRTEVVEYWLTDRGLVADLVVLTGSTDISDSILSKFDQMATVSRSAKAQIDRLYNDAKGLNFGDLALRQWFAQYTPAVFSEAERDALLKLSIRRKVTTAAEVEVASKTNDGQWLI